MEKTIEIQLAEHGERIAQAIIEVCKLSLKPLYMFTPEEFISLVTNIARATK